MGKFHFKGVVENFLLFNYIMMGSFKINIHKMESFGHTTPGPGNY